MSHQGDVAGVALGLRIDEAIHRVLHRACPNWPRLMPWLRGGGPTLLGETSCCRRRGRKRGPEVRERGGRPQVMGRRRPRFLGGSSMRRAGWRGGPPSAPCRAVDGERYARPPQVGGASRGARRRSATESLAQIWADWRHTFVEITQQLAKSARNWSALAVHRPDVDAALELASIAQFGQF